MGVHPTFTHIMSCMIPAAPTNPGCWPPTSPMASNPVVLPARHRRLVRFLEITLRRGGGFMSMGYSLVRLIPGKIIKKNAPSHAWLLWARHRTRWTLKLVGKHIYCTWFTATPKKGRKQDTKMMIVYCSIFFGVSIYMMSLLWIALNHLLSGGSRGPTLH